MSEKSAGRQKRDLLTTIILYAIIVALCIVFLVPIYGAFSIAFRPNKEIIREGFWVLPNPPTVSNFLHVITEGKIQTFFNNTIVVTSLATALSIFMGCLTGYAFGKLDFKGKYFIYIIVIAGLFFPPQIVLIPLFKLFNAMHLLDTRTALVIVHVGFGIPICTLMMSNFFRDIPNELRQSAMIDGANEWIILFKIMLPLAKPSLTALVILQFTWIWNDFLWPLVLMKTESKMTIQMGIMQLRGQYGLAWGNQAAACLIATIPTLLIFLFMQKYFIRGLTMGAIKE
ncbi:MAG: carbohydrate ABC transporter permease [bacterium]|nr:carbohydrate ABC transporter permease [bacterium]